MLLGFGGLGRGGGGGKRFGFREPRSLKPEPSPESLTSTQAHQEVVRLLLKARCGQFPSGLLRTLST